MNWCRIICANSISAQNQCWIRWNLGFCAVTNLHQLTLCQLVFCNTFIANSKVNKNYAAKFCIIYSIVNCGKKIHSFGPLQIWNERASRSFVSLQRLWFRLDPNAANLDFCDDEGRHVCHVQSGLRDQPENINLRGSITVPLTSCLFCWIQLLCLCWISNSFICLVKSKAVKQEISCTVILPVKVSVPWINARPLWVLIMLKKWINPFWVDAYLLSLLQSSVWG